MESEVSENANSPNISSDVFVDPTLKPSQFGFKVIEAEGRKALDYATEDDYRAAEAKRLRIEPHQVEVFVGCHAVPPSRAGGPISYVGGRATPTGGGDKTCVTEAAHFLWYCRCA
jgi:hypothetical protein